MAAFITGIIFGGGSVMFTDVTEGLGCLLGGFCLSMWFLVLKSGGLITSTAGKVILIACFTLGAFGLYISHLTRPYGLIGSISFAGATVIVLGIDCFSRAGLKEFWLYLWDLNGDMFPPHYDKPYPITRGIRVEVACVVLLFLLGIMSQMKIWKIIKERRDRNVTAQLEEERDRDQAEENIGRKLEEGNEQERATWEAVYGDKDDAKRQQVDSGVGTDEPGSVRKGSIGAAGSRDVRNSVSESVEMSNLEGTNSSRRVSDDGNQPRNDGRVMTVRVASDDEIQQAPIANLAPSKDVTTTSTGTSTSQTFHETVHKSPGDILIAKDSTDNRSIKKVEGSSGPQVVPLPFSVPEPGPRNDDDVSSIATFAASDHLLARTSRRASGHSLLRSLSKRSRSDSLAEEELIPHHEDDRASSVAATIDDVSTDRDSNEGESSSRSGEPLQPDNGVADGSLGEPSGVDARSEMEKIKGQGSNGSTPTTNDNGAEASRIIEGGNLNPFSKGSFAGEKLPGTLAETIVPQGQVHSIEKSAAPPKASETHRKPAKLTGLPESASRVVMAFRTNEWAKHLETAEPPELPELDDLNTRSHSERMPLAATETPAPLYLKELQQTALTAEPAPISTDRSQEPRIDRQSKSRDSLADHRGLQRPMSSLRQSPSGNMERSVSQTSLQSIQSKREHGSSTLRLTPSQISLGPSRALRSSSTPLTKSPLIGSPIEEGVESSFPARSTPSPMNLMSQRDSMMRNKASSTSLNRTSSRSPQPAGSSDSLPLQNDRLSALDEDNISLSQRKSLLLQQQQQQHQQQQQQKQLAQYPSRPSHSPLPHRSSSASNPRESTLSAWRSTLRSDLPAQQVVYDIEARRAEMLNEKRRSSTSQQWAALEAGRRESGIDRGMRRGDLMDKHREAMRRMQAGANKHV